MGNDPSTLQPAKRTTAPAREHQRNQGQSTIARRASLSLAATVTTIEPPVPAPSGEKTLRFISKEKLPPQEADSIGLHYHGAKKGRPRQSAKPKIGPITLDDEGDPGKEFRHGLIHRIPLIGISSASPLAKAVFGLVRHMLNTTFKVKLFELRDDHIEFRTAAGRAELPSGPSGPMLDAVFKVVATLSRGGVSDRQITQALEIKEFADFMLFAARQHSHRDLPTICESAFLLYQNAHAHWQVISKLQEAGLLELAAQLALGAMSSEEQNSFVETLCDKAFKDGDVLLAGRILLLQAKYRRNEPGPVETIRAELVKLCKDKETTERLMAELTRGIECSDGGGRELWLDDLAKTREGIAHNLFNEGIAELTRLEDKKKIAVEFDVDTGNIMPKPFQEEDGDELSAEVCSTLVLLARGVGLAGRETSGIAAFNLLQRDAVLSGSTAKIKAVSKLRGKIEADVTILTKLAFSETEATLLLSKLATKHAG